MKKAVITLVLLLTALLAVPTAAAEEELLAGAKELADWMNSKPSDHFIGHIIAFAWNEFEEGGIICPTYNEDGSINMTRLEAFRKAADYLRANVK